MVSALLLVASLAATPPPMTRDQVVARAAPGVGYSYHWGGACWQLDGGGGHGSCSGNCPNCTHSGSYGADCSGYVFKAWQIDGAQSVSTCGHGPYTASSYHTNQTHWTHITRANAKKADALASTTHVVLVLGGDPWGTPTIDEARGCSYGIQHNVRSLGSEFNASQRDNLDLTPPAWKATYVNQSFPYASAPAIQLKEGETVDGFFDLRNDGANAWSADTKLAPTPRDQPSTLHDDSWLSDTRIVSPGAVARNAVGHFAVTLRGGAPGEHIQSFGLVQEGVSWFSSSGGPPDTQLAVKVDVIARDHAGTLVEDGFAKDEDGFVVVEQGSTAQGYVDVRNDGHVTWDSTVRLAPTPRDQPSDVAAASWMSPTRVATADADTPEGSVARFTFEVQGNTVGDFTQTFGLVHEAVTWFADAGFGPADDFFTLKVRVVPHGTFGAAAADGLFGVGPDGKPLAGQEPLPPSVVPSCAQASPQTVGLAAAALALLGLLRRRRRE